MSIKFACCKNCLFSYKHHGGGGKSGAALSALTLLAFMFFLNILQQCLRDHMNSMGPEVNNIKTMLTFLQIEKTCIM